ncbi:MAG: glycosyltransferase family 4 protein [Verrucomicrobiales bacterium]|nr:glycosyltransferase family 4 protein [Verrucomicrobiales bacterium]
MIRVQVPANCFYPELPGGPNQYFRYGPFLRERGVQLVVHTPRQPHHQEKEFEINGIEVHRHDLPAGGSHQRDLELLLEIAIDSVGRGSDASGSRLHPIGTFLESRSALSRLWRARLRGIPSCVHMMMMPEWGSESFPRRYRESLRAKVLFSPYAKMLMCSRVMGRAYAEYAKTSPGRIEAIPNGIDLSVFSPVSPERKRELRTELNLSQEAPLVIYVGSVVPRKGVDLLVEAWEGVLRLHPDAVLLIVGSTGARPTIRDAAEVSETDRYIGEVFDRIEQLSRPGSVHFAGEVENVQEYYRASDLFAFASHREGLPSVILEAMACGLPCVTAPFLGLPDDGEEYGVAGEHYVKSSYAPEELAQDISSLIGDEEAREAMGKKAISWMRETQGMEKATDRLAEIYHEIVG